MLTVFRVVNLALRSGHQGWGLRRETEVGEVGDEWGYGGGGGGRGLLMNSPTAGFCRPAGEPWKDRESLLETWGLRCGGSQVFERLWGVRLWGLVTS